MLTQTYAYRLSDARRAEGRALARDDDAVHFDAHGNGVARVHDGRRRDGRCAQRFTSRNQPLRFKADDCAGFAADVCRLQHGAARHRAQRHRNARSAGRAGVCHRLWRHRRLRAERSGKNRQQSGGSDEQGNAAKGGHGNQRMIWLAMSDIDSLFLIAFELIS